MKYYLISVLLMLSVIFAHAAPINKIEYSLSFPTNTLKIEKVMEEGKEYSDIRMEGTICLTKTGFVPKLFNYVLLQNKIILNDTNYSANLIKTGASLNSHATSGDLEFKKGSHELTAKEIVLEPGTVINKGAVVTFKNK